MRVPIIVAAFAAIFATPSLADLAVVDGDTLKVDGVTFRIEGIDAPEAGQVCQGQSGEWSSGKEAIDELADLVRDATVRCVSRGEDGYGRTIAACTANGYDIGDHMVRTGLAWAFRKYSQTYDHVEEEAKAAGRGVWQAETQTPWEYREEQWTKNATEAPDGCPIKGNISRNGMIYHAPWSPWYDKTVITPQKGERWFCSESDAVAAGWRAPLWGPGL